MYEFTFDNQDDGEAWELAELELVCCVEAGRPFVQASYFLEEDGLICTHTTSLCTLPPRGMLDTTP